MDVYLSLIQREMQAAMVAEQEADETDLHPDNEENAADSEPATFDHATDARNENSPTGGMPLSGCHVDRRMIAEFENSSETDHIAIGHFLSSPDNGVLRRRAERSTPKMYMFPLTESSRSCQT